MIFFKIKIKIQHLKFNSINSTFYIKKNKLPILLNRLKDKDDFIFYVNYWDLSKKNILYILKFYDVNTDNNDISKEALNRYVQNKNIRFK